MAAQVDVQQRAADVELVPRRALVVGLRGAADDQVLGEHVRLLAVQQPLVVEPRGPAPAGVQRVAGAAVVGVGVGDGLVAVDVPHLVGDAAAVRGDRGLVGAEVAGAERGVDLVDHLARAREPVQVPALGGDDHAAVGLGRVAVATVGRHLELARAVRGREPDVAVLDVGDRIGLGGRGERQGQAEHEWGEPHGATLAPAGRAVVLRAVSAPTPKVEARPAPSSRRRAADRCRTSRRRRARAAPSSASRGRRWADPPNRRPDRSPPARARRVARPRRTRTGAPEACLAALVSASAVTHTSVWRTRGSTSSTGSSSSSTSCPEARAVAVTRTSSAATVASPRSCPSTSASRRSSSAPCRAAAASWS